MMLRPEIEEQVRTVERAARDTGEHVEALIARLDDLLESFIDDPIPVEVWDDVSVVNHTIELGRETKRVRRASGLPPIDFTKERKP